MQSGAAVDRSGAAWDTLRVGPGDIDAAASTLLRRGASLGAASVALSTPTWRAAADRALLADPEFGPLYARRARAKLPDLAAAAAMPEGTLGWCYARYMAHYRLSPDFFPIALAPEQAGTPTEYAVCRLNCMHDVMHVLGAYEVHHADEIAVQSFVFGHSPVVHAAFLAAAAAHPALGLARYKHLRDIYDGPIRREDYLRGRAAAPLLGLAFEVMFAAPVDALRRRLGVADRVERPRGTGNSCGGATEQVFFTADGA